MTNSSYDIAVVGAGPAGTTVARELSKKGFSTVLLDRRKEIGLPIQCGELVPTPKEMQDLFPSSKRAIHLMRIPSRFVTNKTSCIHLISPGGRFFEFAFETNILDRAAFDRWLADRAEQAGAELRLRTTLIERPGRNLLHVKGPKGVEVLEAKVIVGADGPNSLIARSIGSCYSNLERDMSIAVQYAMDGIETDSNTIEMYFGNHLAPGGYLWIIPTGKSRCNIGLGLRQAFKDPNKMLHGYLDRALSKHARISKLAENAQTLRRVSAFIPVGGPHKKTADPSTVLVGDAAGHVMASNGGGIPTALIGADIASESIIDHLERAMPLTMYEARWKREMGKELETALSILRIADRVMPSDTLTDQCMRLAGSRFLEPMIRCRLPLLVDFASRTFVWLLRKIE